MSKQLIIEALQTASTAAVHDSTQPSMPVQYLGRVFEPPSDNKFVECVHIENDRADDYYDESMVYQGAWRLILHWPIDDEGTYPPILYAEELAAGFSKDRPLLNGGLRIQIYQNPRVSGPIKGDTELLFPVTVQYRCFRT